MLTTIRIVAKLQALLLGLAKSKNLKPIYRRNILLARVAAVFALGEQKEEDVENGQPSSLRLKELLCYIDDQRQIASCFDDVKEFLEQLDAPGLKHVAVKFSGALTDHPEDFMASARLALFSLKTRFLLSSHPNAGSVLEEDQSASCQQSLAQLSADALSAHKKASHRLALEKRASSEDVLVELAMLAALCNVQLAESGCYRSDFCSPAASRCLLRAAMILEQQALITPKNSQLSLLLVRIHLLLNSAHRGREIWETLAVKRTIVDSLAPLFFDRLSTIAPGVLDPLQRRGKELIETVRSHYDTSLRLRMPRKLIEAFEAGSYGSVLDMPKYIENLRAGCTRAMSLVEETRAGRLLGDPCSNLLNDARLCKVSITHV